MITRARLRNWRSHAETELRFGDGTNVLVGSMGAGKTTVLDAITFALFGTLPQVQARRIKLEDLIRSRPRPLDSAEVEVGFIAPDGNEYVVKRAIERGKGTTYSELRRASGELIESPSASRVTEVIQPILKLDYDLFERAIYSEQNRLDYFLTLPPGKRMQSIDELLGIDKLEEARKGAGSLANRISDRLEEVKRLVGQLSQDVELSLLPAREQELMELESSRGEIALELERLRPELSSIEAKIQKLREAERKIAQLRERLSEFEGGLKIVERQLEQLKERLGPASGADVGELGLRVRELELAHNEARRRAEALDRELSANASLVGELEAKIGALGERSAELAAEVERKSRSREELERLDPQGLAERTEELRLELRRTTEDLAAHRARIQDLQRASDELASAGPLCPTCESPLEEARKRELLEERAGRLEALKEHAALLEGRASELEDALRRNLELQEKVLLLSKEVEGLESLEGERSRILKRLEELGRRLADSKVAAERLRLDAERARSEAEKLREEIQTSKQTLQLLADAKQLEGEYGRRLAMASLARHELGQLERTYDEARARELEGRRLELARIQERLGAELAGKDQLISEKRKLIEGARGKLAVLRRYELEAKHMQEAIDALTKIQSALVQAQVALRRDFIEGVNQTMGELWESIYPYRDFAGIRLAVGDGVRRDYVLQLRDRAGNWVPVDGLASGGERTDACLALRIAFAVVLAPALSWLVLDEPTHNLDEDGIRELAEVLRERVPEVVRQVLIITHEERLEQAVSGYLYRFSRDKDADGPTKVECVTTPERLVRA